MACIGVAASPLSGHVMPMALIGAHLRSLGHEMILLTGQDHHRAAVDSGLRFRTARYRGAGPPTAWRDLAA